MEGVAYILVSIENPIRYCRRPQVHAVRRFLGRLTDCPTVSSVTSRPFFTRLDYRRRDEIARMRRIRPGLFMSDAKLPSRARPVVELRLHGRSFLVWRPRDIPARMSAARRACRARGI